MPPKKKRRQDNKKKEKKHANSDEKGIPPPINSLPDELLSRILSLIDEIPFKFALEAVCKRFQRISMLSSSWNNIDRLDLHVKCRGYSRSMSGWKMTGGCPVFVDGVKTPHYTSLNGLNIDLDKWPAAVDMLLNRTVVTKLGLHFDEEKRGKSVYDCKHILPLPPDFLNSILSVFRSNQKHLKLERFEFHLWATTANDLVLWALEHATPTLKHLAMFFEGINDYEKVGWERNLGSFWAVVSKCPNLESVYVAPLYTMEEPTQMPCALHSKPLTKFGLCAQLHKKHFLPTVQSVCNSSGREVESLVLATSDLIDLRELSCQRGALQSLTIDNQGSTRSADEYLGILPELPRLFPSLTTLELRLDHQYRQSQATDLDLLVSAAFFNACDLEAMDRKIVFPMLNVHCLEMFRYAATKLSEANDVKVEIEGEQWLKVKLSRGNATIRVDKLQEHDQKQDQEDWYQDNKECYCDCC